jgi:ATP-dependent helicase/nuclease subunit A
MSKLKIYKASAGSGKTHSLTEEYLSLAALYPDNFKRILAVTFTNKAAEEMKQRILESLNDILKLSEKADFYHVFRRINKDKSPFEILESVRQVRDSILHNYSYFSLSTIDSFVQKVIKSFTYEIGVESGYRIELDTEKVLSDITELLYKQIDTDENLRNWLIHFANYKMDEGKNWDFRAEINKLAREIFKEEFESVDLDENEEGQYKAISENFEKLNQIKQSFEKQMTNIGKQTIEIFTKQNIDYQNLGQKMGWLGNYLTRKITEPSKVEDYVPTPSVQKLLDDVESWTAKSASAEIKRTVNGLFYQVNPLLNKAISLIQNDFKYYLGAINILSAFHAYGILRKLAALLPEYRSRNNLLLISDSTRILKEIIAGNDAPFIYEKIGNRFRHVLIDEFQDTSGFQWENFKPLIQNSLAEGQTNLIVGDIKQSIYRWRGGDWSLLLSKVDEEIGNTYIEHKTLETNWRSKKNVIDFNNSFFKIVSESLQNLFNSELDAGDKSLMDEGFDKQFKQVISRAYADTFQKLPDKPGKKGGRVKIQFYNQKGVSKDWQKDVSEDLPQVIEQLLTRKNYHPGDLAILVRKNSEGRELANLLLDYQNSNPDALKYQIISSESLMLANSPIIQILVNAMHFLFKPDDNIRLHALVTVYNQTFDPERKIEHFFYANEEVIKAKQLLPLEFFRKLEKLRSSNIYEITEELCRIFSLNRLKGQLAYLQSFQDLVADFGQNEAIDLGAFIQWWEEKGKNNSVQLSDQQDALKILSIHKSKGLAFKVVLIPFCDWPLKPSATQDIIMWTNSHIEPFSDLGNFPVIFRKYLANSVFYKEYYEEVLYSFIDALNMLYVAFTRSKDELIVMAPVKEKKPKSPGSIADLLYDAIEKPMIYEGLVDLNKHFYAQTNLFELHQDYNDIDGDKFVKEIKEKPSFELQEYPAGDWNSKISIQHSADDFFMKSIEYIQEKVNYGTLMHDLFSRIKDGSEIETLVDEFYYAGKIGSEEKSALIRKVKEMINRPMVSNWFSDKWEVKTEDGILNQDGKIRIPDRVLIGKEETLVIDYKFGQQYDESIAQVKEYVELLRSMDYPNVKGFVYYAEKNIVENVE